MSQKIPPDTWGSEIIKRYKKDPEGLTEALLINRKIDASQYIQIKLLMSISKTLNELIQETKEFLDSLNPRTQVSRD